MSENICRFVSKQGNESEINILNFVYETTKQKKTDIKNEAMYKIHLVTKGSGKILTGGKTWGLRRGDLFFTFPAVEYSVLSGRDFEYMYISFLGIRTNKLLDKMNISARNFLFKNQQGLISLWKQSISENKYVLSLRCEGLLLYSFSVLQEQEVELVDEHGTLTEKIKSYIDEHFADAEISLEGISKIFSYNKKYISTAFKKEFHLGIAEYISTLRVQYACTLMNYGISSVGEIAQQCGFSDPQYFSRVFKNKIGVSPKEYIIGEKKK